MGDVSRREMMKRLAGLGTLLAAGVVDPRIVRADGDPVLAGRPLVRYPEKTELILLTSRPPQLETPMKYFDQAQRGVLRPLSRLPHPARRRPGDVAATRHRARGSLARAVTRRSQDEVPAGV